MSQRLARVVRPLVTLAGLLLLWQAAHWLNGERDYLLPGPLTTAQTAWAKAPLLLDHALITGAEILLGLLLGCLLGVVSALALAQVRTLERWLLPLLVISQAIPVFAIAPLLVLWLGYGLASKVAMATLIIYFPVTAAFLDGLRQTDPLWLDQARVMQARPWRVLLLVRLPAALPALASGLRVATAVAPIGAVVGEWVGASGGLGYLMLHANARMQIDLMFAALFTLALFAVALYWAVDRGLARLLPWVPDSRTRAAPSA
ncbi:ABC transporter permease [Roseospirillum parvum]|uniref:Putative hydroxymethylpyrimidine transport system permease protein n=1 Tax=Roseospirillum parvum TaxID=83401 RepID=A0A1G8B8V6_9PROT|nr:ABC transporter permease [Roseospirillum parvum]SDH29020.1 putative hydroxymethylpyrimidine transport system permease protein [Roseospirillum parvum]